MIVAPLNDVECLSELSHVADEGTRRASVSEIAARFATPAELARWIRSLPQRNDGGDPRDGPRIACDVSQRARVPAKDPNCVERSLLYLAAAELLDPRPRRALATISTPLGRHTFPVEEGRPVVLDPVVSRNALAAGLYLMQASPQDPMPAAHPAEILSWMAEIAEEPAYRHSGAEGVARVRQAHRALGALLEGTRLPQSAHRNLRAFLAHAERAAPLFGRSGQEGVAWIRQALSSLGVLERPNRHERRNGARPPAPARSAPPSSPALLAGTLAGIHSTPRNVSWEGLRAKARRVDWERAGYVSGKAIATAYGLGALYDPAYAELRGKPSAPTPATAPSAKGAAQPLPEAPAPRLAPMPGSLWALKGGR